MAPFHALVVCGGRHGAIPCQVVGVSCVCSVAREWCNYNVGQIDQMEGFVQVHVHVQRTCTVETQKTLPILFTV